MQRLKQHNSGAALPLDDNEILSAATTQALPAGGWCHVRMRLSRDGEAERSVHLYNGQAHSAFHHEQVVAPAAFVAEISEALRAARLEREAVPEQDDDSQALYRTIVFRDGSARPTRLAVEYQHGEPVGPATAFEAAWELLAQLFPSIRPGQGAIPDLRW